jgi:cellobiose phosphorylase
VEPYVVAADVYSAPRHMGRGGWTWYTGSASWMYRLGVEKILGVQRRGNQLTIKPCIPQDWREYTIHYRFGTAMYHIHVENSKNANNNEIKLTLDGNLPNNEVFLLETKDDGLEHNIHVKLNY